MPDIDRLLEENDDVRIVFRELPILSPESEQAARVSLSAARQREYMDFHRAMYAAGRPNTQTIAEARREAGLNAAQVESDMNADAVVAELQKNLELARQLELTGTPAFIVGDRVLSGAVGYDRLRQAVQEARTARSGD
jgi:protein-disulfide isomerase